jgi:hypothetical protein
MSPMLSTARIFPHSVELAFDCPDHHFLYSVIKRRVVGDLPQQLNLSAGKVFVSNKESGDVLAPNVPFRKASANRERGIAEEF